MAITIPGAIYSRDFRLYLSGQIISLTGTWMQSVAQNWLVWSITGSSFYLGLIGGASSLPMLLFTLIGGILADRFPKRRLLILTQSLSIIPALILAIFIDLKIITVLHIAILAFVLGTINALDVPVRQSFLVEMVGKESLTGAIALNSAIFNGARLIGPMIAGLILSIFSISTCFYINAMSYIPVVIALLMMKTEGLPSGKNNSVRGGLREAIGFVLSDRVVLYLLLLIMLFSLVAIPYIILLPAIAEGVFQGGPRLYGLMMGIIGGGSLTGALFIAFRGEGRGKINLIALFTTLFSILLFLLSTSGMVSLSLIFLFFTGFCVISFLATANSLIQHRTPDHLRGRVMSLYTLVFLGMSPPGNLIAGSLASVLGPMTALKVISIVTLGGTLIFRVLTRPYGIIERP